MQDENYELICVSCGSSIQSMPYLALDMYMCCKECAMKYDKDSKAFDDYGGIKTTYSGRDKPRELA